MEAIALDVFQYNIITRSKYLEVELIGKLEENGIREAYDEIVRTSQETGVKRVLYDASKVKQSDETRQSGIEYFKLISSKMDKLASFVPEKKIYALAVFMSIVGSIKNWKPFLSKERAIEWLES